jgi:hypothetical protein
MPIRVDVLPSIAIQHQSAERKKQDQIDPATAQRVQELRNPALEEQPIWIDPETENPGSVADFAECGKACAGERENCRRECVVQQLIQELRNPPAEERPTSLGLETGNSGAVVQ